MLLFTAAPLSAQDRQARQITVATALARFDGTPFTTDDWVVEVVEIDTETRELQLAIAFWGPDALAFPLQIRGLRWSFRGDRLAMTFLERSGDEQIAVYDTDALSLDIVLPADSHLTDISAVDWSQRSDWLVFSARSDGGESRVMQLSLSDSELTILADGRLPSLGPDDAELAFLNENDEITILSLDDDSERIIPGAHPNTTSMIWSGDGARLALTSDVYVSTVDVQSGRERRIFDVYVHLDVPENSVMATTRSAAWSPDNLMISFILTVIDADGMGGVSQVIGIDAEDATAEIYAERLFADNSPDDPRIFLEVTYQSRGAFLPPRDSGSDI
jgi:WD40 repeat protein